ncbi:hypothetical protein CANMA_004497 [Candida margitis]|uniref:uncharacterized protein n=1 Tax=Candida margitis TaxID=1775924 RepID=UPI0022276713|nr:uncharacterized protein CANMA_004497 [Candida margitis]KAI5956660.1 hypothetical protein CANMA_004497 [Candida margitis]
MTQVQLSPCRNYVGQIQPLEDSIVLNIFQTPHNTLHRSFQMIELIQSRISLEEIPTSLDISFQWEYPHNGRECKKLAVLARNMSALFILDINKDESSSVLIRQPQTEGIESFQWIIPTESEEAAGHSNSSQLLLFSTSSLSAKLFSLDCTHKLFTVDKPLSDRVIYRRTTNGTFWCLIADTFEYNVPPTMNQFLNTGPLSIPVNSVRFQNFVSEEAHVDWSPSGNWLQVLDRNETLSGYSLKVYGSNGSDGPDLAKPLVDIEFANEVEVEVDGMVKTLKGATQSCWFSSDDEELLLLARVMGHNLELQVVSMKLLKVVKRKVKNLKNTAPDLSSKGSLEVGVKKVFQLHEFFFVQLGNHLLYCFRYYSDELKFITNIESRSEIVDVIVDKDRWFIITTHQILLHEKSIVRPIFSTNETIYFTSLLDKESLIVLNQGPRSELWIYININQATQNSQNKSAAGNQSIDEMTDTFAMRKRARIK